MLLNERHGSFAAPLHQLLAHALGGCSAVVKTESKPLLRAAAIVKKKPDSAMHDAVVHRTAPFLFQSGAVVGARA